MRDELPSLRLTGGDALIGGNLMRAPVCIADTRVAGDGEEEIDVSGHFVLPGIVDLRSCAWSAQPRGVDVRSALTASAAELARHGVTTAWISAALLRGDPHTTPDRIEAFCAAMPGVATASGLTLSPRLELDTSYTERSAAMINLVRHQALSFVGFLPLADLLKETSTSEPGSQSAWSSIRAQPMADKAQLRTAATARAAQMPRHVCQLAAACDEAGIRYGSLYDRDAEAREHFRMLGAGIADSPLSRTAASSAQAMDDPVLLEARDVISPTRQQSWVGAGLVSALVSGDTPSALLRAVLALDAQGVVPLPQAWPLISRNPARIAGLRDRGDLVVGQRADLIILDPATGHNAATLSGGRLVAGQGPIADRLAQVSGRALAAE